MFQLLNQIRDDLENLKM